MTAYSNAIDKLSAALVAQYDTIFSHAGNKGDARESVVLQFLKKVCPERLGFANGEMFDDAGSTSGEVDLVVYDKVYSPVFHDGSGKILAPVESTFGAIEIKSTLTTTELRDADAKFAKYRALKRDSFGPNVFAPSPHVGLEWPFGKLNHPPGASRAINGVFAFKNDVAVNTVLEWVSGSHHIDYVVVPNQFFAFRNSHLQLLKVPIEGGHDLLVQSPSSVALWVLLLQLHAGRMQLKGLELPQLFGSIVVASRVQIQLGKD